MEIRIRVTRDYKDLRKPGPHPEFPRDYLLSIYWEGEIVVIVLVAPPQGANHMMDFLIGKRGNDPIAAARRASPPAT